MAVNKYIDSIAASGVSEQASGVSGQASGVSGQASGATSLQQQAVGFSLLTWNVDGLDESNISERARAVCAYIYESQPDIVFLQELVAENVSIFNRCPGYTLHVPRAEQCPYFCGLMLRQTSVKCLSVHTTDFPSSCMYRHLIKATVQVQPSGVSVTLFTSHLESTARHANERKRQLQFVFDQMQHTSPGYVIFGGDLNVRDAEVATVGVPPNFGDAWEASCSPKDSRYTWDRSRNDNIEGRLLPRVKMRFDRVYFSKDLRPEGFRFVGLERLPFCGRFPSDHYGITCRFL